MIARRVAARAAGIVIGAGVLLGATGLAASGAPASDDATGVFRALTYNVAGLPVGLSSSEPDINTPFISPMLNAYDLVLVQEDWANPDPPLPGTRVFHEILVGEATHPYQSTPLPVPLGTNPDRPTALVSDGLNRLSRMPFGDVTRTMWPNCFGGGDTSDGGAGDCLSTKGFSVATTELAPGVEIDVYNLHGEAGSTPADRAYRAEGYAALATYINAHSADRAVLVGGDFNLHTDRSPDGEVFSSLLESAGLTDVCQVVDCGADSNQIDKFVFRNGGGVTLTPLTHAFEGATFVRPTDGAPLSDHDPLSVDWQWAHHATPIITTTTPAETTVVGAPVTTQALGGPAAPTSNAPTPGPSAQPTVYGAPAVEELPRTGRASTWEALAGMGLVLAGAAVVAASRRRVKPGLVER